jgi:L-threonylcarbamoyladenylate synthase
MATMHTRIVRGDGEGIEEAARLLQAGELVAFPTETVYGLGSDARRPEAVRKIYEAKGRPPGNPVIVHVRGIAEAKLCAGDGIGGWDERAELLAGRFWPGPLTLVLARRGAVGGEWTLAEAVSAGRDTVALRCPGHPVALELLNRFGGPVAAPSANRSGFTSPTTAAHVMAELSGRVPLIVDGGACAVGLESTVVDLTNRIAKILRPGAVTAEMLREVLEPWGGVQAVAGKLVEGAEAESPGMYERHYAPRTRAYRFERKHWQRVKEWAEGCEKVALLSWSDEVALAAPHETMRLPGGEAGGVAESYARVMYAALREADEFGAEAILVLMPESTGNGMWTAVADRLRRATVELPIE